jgi:2-oxoglutarate ferredoxin oxidoreductase subunit alpha
MKEVFTFLVGGKAGEGVKKAGSVAAHLFSSMGRHVFQLDDYQSLIKGGHNFSVVSTARRKITSHYAKADLVIAMDKRSYDMHREHLAGDGTMVYNADTVKDAKEGVGVPLLAEAKKYPNPNLRIGVGAVTVLAATIGFGKEELKNLINQEYPRDIENNIAYAMAVYDIVYPKIGGKYSIEKGNAKSPIFSGNVMIALGAAASGLDIYYAYPMTPSTSILHYLAAHDKDLDLVVVHPENEIGVINMAIGSTFSGARVMIGSSGGGFALMQEAFSLAGMVEAPLLCVLSSRPGPSTGVPTYTGQGDLSFAIHQGHGEFPRIVASPGSIEEAFYLAGEMLDLVWRFQTPAILLTEKHLSECSSSVEIDIQKAGWPDALMHKGGEYKRYLDSETGVSPLLFSPSKELIRWNSYEHDELGITTEKPELTTKMHDKRRKKGRALTEYLKGMRTVNKYGDKGPIIMTYGSTTMSVLEAVNVGGIEATIVQPKYLEPLPTWELAQFRDKVVVVVEQSAAGQFSSLLKEKAGINAKNVIKKYDGRPFDPIELAGMIKEAMHG